MRTVTLLAQSVCLALVLAASVLLVMRGACGVSCAPGQPGFFMGQGGVIAALGMGGAVFWRGSRGHRSWTARLLRAGVSLLLAGTALIAALKVVWPQLLGAGSGLVGTGLLLLALAGAWQLGRRGG